MWTAARNTPKQSATAISPLRSQLCEYLFNFTAALLRTLLL